MAEKGLRRLKRRELLQMLLVQCEESERLQQKLDAVNERFAVMSESYERLKKKLDVKDERLNEKDAQIEELMLRLEALESAEAEDVRKTDPRRVFHGSGRITPARKTPVRLVSGDFYES